MLPFSILVVQMYRDIEPRIKNRKEGKQVKIHHAFLHQNQEPAYPSIIRTLVIKQFQNHATFFCSARLNKKGKKKFAYALFFLWHFFLYPIAKANALVANSRLWKRINTTTALPPKARKTVVQSTIRQASNFRPAGKPKIWISLPSWKNRCGTANLVFRSRTTKPWAHLNRRENTQS